MHNIKIISVNVRCSNPGEDLLINVKGIVPLRGVIRYQFEMPAELQEVLNSDPEANEIFHSLTPGNQRGLIYLVSKIKSVDKRTEKALRIA